MIGTFSLRAVEAALSQDRFRGSIHHFSSVTSTNALALEAARAGVLEGVWVADEQTAGRGRGGHRWHSTAGDGLYVSVLSRLALSVSQALLLSLSTGLAAKQAIHTATGLGIDLRWPNDLMLRGRKCGGILAETAVAAAASGQRESTFRHVVLGVGINVNHTAFPPCLEAVATSLRIEYGQPISRESLLAALLNALVEEIGLLKSAGADDVLARFTAASSWVLGKQVRVGESGTPESYAGITAGLTSEGFLRVATDDGIERTVLSGGVREA